MNDADMMKQANQIWSMLDEMAESDPKGYKKFIQKQSDEEKLYNMPPVPNMCIQTLCKGSEELFINVFSWGRITYPSLQDSATQCSCSTFYIDNDKNLISIAFHPSILDKFSFSDENKLHPDLFVPQIIRHIIKMYSVPIRSEFIVLRQPRCMGNQSIAVSKLVGRLGDMTSMKGYNASLAMLGKKFPKSFERAEDDAVDPTDDLNHPFHNVKLLDIMPMSTYDENSVKIVEVPNFKDDMPNKVPEYKIMITDGMVNVRVLVSRITNKNLIDLTISEDDFVIKAYGYSKLKIKLNLIIDKRTIRTLFSIKTCELLIWAELDKQQLPECIKNGSVVNAEIINDKIVPVEDYVIREFMKKFRAKDGISYPGKIVTKKSQLPKEVDIAERIANLEMNQPEEIELPEEVEIPKKFLITEENTKAPKIKKPEISGKKGRNNRK